MTFTELLATLVISVFFFSGLSQAAMPVLRNWQNANEAYQYAHTLAFLNGSFRNACGTPSRNIEKWKKDISIVSGLESCELSEIKKDETVVAMKASLVVWGEQLELIADCTP